MIREAIARIVDGASLTAEEAAAVMGEIMDGQATPAQIGALITALRMKGETPEEIAGFAVAMRQRAHRIEPQVPTFVDVVGTGGDRSGTFNISTVAAFVVAGAGVPVAKHNNRAVSSRCGSADLLEALGVPADVEPERARRAIEEVGIGFLFAPRFHPAMRHAAGPRREVGIRTVFNVLGPLTNPAGARHQVVGVYHASLVEPVARVLQQLGTRHAFVVHGDGMDELAPSGPSYVAEVREGQVRTFELQPEDAGLPRHPAQAVRGGEASQNARLALSVLRGERGAHRDVVLLNAAAALVAAGTCSDLRQGAERAAESIDRGAALGKLEQLRHFLGADA
ncbi:MAG: anthranilate phosphoribosyltransferase [Armatimonadota bacterium]|nr:anthranilate phosphoribosyltransferase [Armatimonadota bacterium]MDR7429770.1 anthranilate phosphoribosyltransferase [Armatimonadota bacterium]MDR7526229.1 anthranilate phosphoribosyltransferase [Armatimonadota bacterium]MDR7542203.1 anthranilate phosphoribosyltransferase [Armatimonadota bacterium]MDR7566633.1 anthranilate phosphoribosyltransferase [Armatimonadota bacterium]